MRQVVQDAGESVRRAAEGTGKLVLAALIIAGAALVLAAAALVLGLRGRAADAGP